MSNSFKYRMPAGIPGALTRGANSATVEPCVLNAAAPFTAYGKFGKTVAEKFVPLAGGEAAAAITGILVRPFPTTSSQDGLTVSTPPASGVADRARRGYVSVHLDKGAAAKDAQVYVRVTAAGGDVVGQVETAADAGNCVAVTNCFFTGPADADGNTEIAFNI